FFERHDRNRDGKVTRDEFTGPPAEFERNDRNHDGVVDRADGLRGA
ncbi:MAG: transaldolase, partial [Planctomycetota bacterium]